MWWWASAGFPLEGPMCFGASAQDNCTNYNVIFYSAWQIAEFASHWAGLITAIFIVFLAIATARLWRSKLWRATYATMQHSGRASKNELRAYVGVASRSGISERLPPEIFRSIPPSTLIQTSGEQVSR
jgi:hypothetical protein